MKTTDHGENIAAQIQGEDAYGAKGVLTDADLYQILDNIHTQRCDTGQDTTMLERWMEELRTLDPEVV